jgi:ribosome-binding protein aMBF1 (putative translation factor)
MRDDEKRRLEAKGWRVGSAKGFLGLTAEEEAFIDIRLRLADALRRQRARRGVTQLALAKMVRSSQSRVAKMEAGDATVSIDLLVRALLTLGVSRREVGRAIASTSAAA